MSVDLRDAFPLLPHHSTKRLKLWFHRLLHWSALIFPSALSVLFCLPFSLFTKGHRSVSLLSCDVLLLACWLKGHKSYSRIKHSKMPPDQNSVNVTPLTYCCMCSLKNRSLSFNKQWVFLQHITTFNWCPTATWTASILRGSRYFSLTTLQYTTRDLS